MVDGSQADAASVQDSGAVGDRAVDRALSLDRTNHDLSGIPAFIRLKPGVVQMNAPAGDPCPYFKDEFQVVLTHSFELMRTEATQRDFEQRMGFNASVFNSTNPTDQRYCGQADCGSNPVDYARWHHAAYYCNRLSETRGLTACYQCEVQPPFRALTMRCQEAPAYVAAGIYNCPGYRLPTEAEWEYAYRAGSFVPFYPAGSSDGQWSNAEAALHCADHYCDLHDANVEVIGWYCANSGNRTHPVGQKAPNAWQLFDMAGNVSEWCNDWEQPRPTGQFTNYGGGSIGTARIRKGGWWDAPAGRLRAADYSASGDPTTNNDTGFRCARSLLGPE